MNAAGFQSLHARQHKDSAENMSQSAFFKDLMSDVHVQSLAENGVSCVQICSEGLLSDVGLLHALADLEL